MESWFKFVKNQQVCENLEFDSREKMWLTAQIIYGLHFLLDKK